MMKFSKDFLREGTWLKKDTVVKEIVGRGRWAVDYRRVFRHEGRFYETFYSVGATEGQEQSPYDSDPDEIECREVKAVEKTVTVYV
jgi:hypothetical protein